RWRGHTRRSSAAPRPRLTAGAGNTSTSGRAPRASTPGRPRCSATSSRSACSGCRGARSMAADTPILDVWTQHLSPTAPRANPAGENVFRNYGMLDEYHGGTNLARMIERMDRHGVKIALMAGDNEAVAKAMNQYPGRIFGQYHADPTHIMKAVR